MNNSGNNGTRRNNGATNAAAANNSAPANGSVSANNSGAMMGGRRRRATRKGRAGGIPAVGTKAQVYHGTAKHTSGGLVKKDLMKTKKGRIVSRKKHAAGKKALKRLVKAGYKAKKGRFSLFKRG